MYIRGVDAALGAAQTFKRRDRENRASPRRTTHGRRGRSKRKFPNYISIWLICATHRHFGCTWHSASPPLTGSSTDIEAATLSSYLGYLQL